MSSEKCNHNICRKMNGLRMNESRSQSQKERKNTYASSCKIKPKVSMYVYINKCTCRHIVQCRKDNKEGSMLGNEED